MSWLLFAYGFSVAYGFFLPTAFSTAFLFRFGLERSYSAVARQYDG
jgi:Sec-independent protein secretion pathway component TatC